MTCLFTCGWKTERSLPKNINKLNSSEKRKAVFFEGKSFDRDFVSLATKLKKRSEKQWKTALKSVCQDIVWHQWPRNGCQCFHGINAPDQSQSAIYHSNRCVAGVSRSVEHSNWLTRKRSVIINSHSIRTK